MKIILPYHNTDRINTGCVDTWPKNVVVYAVTDEKDMECSSISQYSKIFIPRNGNSIGADNKKPFVKDMLRALYHMFPGEDWYGIANADLELVNVKNLITNNNKDYDVVIHHRTDYLPDGRKNIMYAGEDCFLFKEKVMRYILSEYPDYIVGSTMWDTSLASILFLNFAVTRCYKNLIHIAHQKFFGRVKPDDRYNLSLYYKYNEKHYFEYRERYSLTEHERNRHEYKIEDHYIFPQKSMGDKKRMAVIMHPYHFYTKSTPGIMNYLSSDFVINYFADRRFSNNIHYSKLMKGLPVSSSKKLAEYDAVIYFQSTPERPIVNSNTIWVPMHDQNRFPCNVKAHKYIHFCYADYVLNKTERKTFVQYYPPVKPQVDITKAILFYWYRSPSFNWRDIRQLWNNDFWRFEKIIIKNHPDPEQSKVYRFDFANGLTFNDKSKLHIYDSNFYNSLDDIGFNTATVVMAPRLREGIGLFGLEAMAQGSCLVAPNSPPFNEYIENGVTGILFDTEIFEPIQITPNEIQKICVRARQKIGSGHAQWKGEFVPQLVEFINTSF